MKVQNMKKIFNIISLLMIICVVGFLFFTFSVGIFVDSVREKIYNYKYIR